MILTCPECATRYSVADNSVGPEGRTVRCTSCGLTWRAEPDTALELDRAPTPEPPPAPADDLPRAFRERIAAQKLGRRTARSGLVLGGAAAGFLLAVASVVLGRDDVVAVWPKTASAYAGLGLAVNSVGLVIEDQKAQVGWENGRPTVLVTGKLRNVRNKPVASPPLRFSLLDGAENDLGARVFQVTNADIPPGGARTFVAKLHNPPESVQDVEISFELGREEEAHAATGHGAAKGHRAAKGHGDAKDHGGAKAHKPAEAHAEPAHGEPASHGEPAHPPAAHTTVAAHTPEHAEGHGKPSHGEPPHAPAMRAAHGAEH